MAGRVLMQVSLLLAAGAVGTALAETRIWDGGGADAHLSTAANWEGDVAPQSGDVLVFAGNVNTSPVNDYDPETTSFAALVFSNNCATTALSAPFTLSGNKIVLTGDVKYNGAGGLAIYTMNVAPSSKSLTETLDLEISLPNNEKECSRFGGSQVYRHHLLFKKTVSAPGGSLYSADQTQSTATFEGPVVGFSRVNRPNGPGTIWLKSAENVFSSSAPAHALSEGTLKVDSAAAAGGSGAAFTLGQPAYPTPGKLYVNASEDTTFTGALVFRGPNYRSGGAMVLSNMKAGTTLTFTGAISASVSHSTYGDCEGLGTGVNLCGAGNGVLAGKLWSKPVWIYKTDAGTWRLDGSSVSTGAVVVSAGTLLVNGDWSKAQRSTVASNAALGGTGSLGDVTFASGAVLAATNLAGNTAFHVGALTLPNTITVNLLDAEAPPAGTYTLLTFDSCSGSGIFALGTGWPDGTSLQLGATSLTASVPSATRTWTGAVSSAWDFTTANWTGGLYRDDYGVIFGDAGETTSVTIPAEVRPTGSVVVTGTKDYTFSGSPIAGASALTKGGSGTLTLANASTYTGDTVVSGGVLLLEGSLSGTSLHVMSGAAFTNAWQGKISGAGGVVNEGTMQLNGTNDFTGGLVLKGPTVVTCPRALGAGDVTLGGKDTVYLTGGEAVGRGRTLHVEYSDESESHPVRMARAGTFTWLGDVVIRQRRLFLYMDSGRNFVFGEPGCTTTVSSSGIEDGNLGFYLRSSGTARFYSRIDFGDKAGITQTDSNSIYLHASGNTWSKLTVKVGGVYCYAKNALAPAPVQMGQTYQQLSFNPLIDLGGFDQTITALVMADSVAASSQKIRSTHPATLTVSNDVDTTTLRMQCAILGAVSLRKDGAGTWTFGGSNQTTGNVEVVAGTLKLTASDTLPAGRYSTLTIAQGAKVVLDEGVAASISYATVGGHALKAGVYCGEGGTGTRLDAYLGPGAGSLTVTHGVSGLVILFR